MIDLGGNHVAVQSPESGKKAAKLGSSVSCIHVSRDFNPCDGAFKWEKKFNAVQSSVYNQSEISQSTSEIVR